MASLIALSAGCFAALASLFAKLALDERTSSLSDYLYTALPLMDAVDNDTFQVGVRMMLFGCIFACNALMWGLFTRALNKSSSSGVVTVLNTASNFCVTALLGHFIFHEPLGMRWWMGAACIAAGTVIMTLQDKSKQE
jgi:uncharacterized membrane protein